MSSIGVDHSEFLGEDVASIAAEKVAAEWYPPRERGTLNGLVQAGAVTGAVVTPPIVVAVFLGIIWARNTNAAALATTALVVVFGALPDATLLAKLFDALAHRIAGQQHLAGQLRVRHAGVAGQLGDDPAGQGAEREGARDADELDREDRDDHQRPVDPQLGETFE